MRRSLFAIVALACAVLEWTLIIAGVRVAWRGGGTEAAACSVAELLDTQLEDTWVNGTNSALLPSSVGYVRSVFRVRTNASAGTQRDRLDGIVRSLRCLERLANATDTQWWLIGGSLVGAFRHGAQLPHDTDADVQMDEADWFRAVDNLRRVRRLQPPFYYDATDRHAWSRLGHKIVLYCDGHCAVVPHHGSNLSLVAAVVDVGSGFYTDVWVGNVISLADNDSSGVFRWFEFGQWRQVPLADLFPLRRMPLHPFTNAPVPRSTATFLAQSFDDDFEHPSSTAALLAYLVPGGAVAAVIGRLLLAAAFLFSSRRHFQQRRFYFVGSGIALTSVLFVVRMQCHGWFALCCLYLSASLLLYAIRMIRVMPTPRYALVVPALSVLWFSWLLRTWLARVSLPSNLFASDLVRALLATDYKAIWSGE